MTLYSSHASTVTCIVVCFRFANEAEVSVESLLKIDLTMQHSVPKIIQRENLVAVMYDMDVVVIVLLDVRDSRSLTLKTTVETHVRLHITKLDKLSYLTKPLLIGRSLGFLRHGLDGERRFTPMRRRR